ncbi:unnamed protein product [Heligmosomoides polygyrus]|uniref:C-type lectin domain-containing protein n=1 Tax=Heligmosomoides polygyrus TaxID=6339 RepID=A0A3P8B2K1_HELPZ|nr:unnamed protein product [Heligmosomoides polygyrus]
MHSCFLAPHHPLTWYEAEDYCIKYQAHLVSVGGSKESDSVRALADQHNPQFLTWIGLSRDRNTTEAPFFWSDGREFNFTSFREGEPTDFGNCVALSSSSEADSWMTIDCDYSQFFLCKRPAHGFQPIILTSSSGEFQSPGYPTAYSDDISVNYFIEVLRPEQRVLVTVEHIETEESHDFLEIFDGSGGGGVTLAKLSGMHRNRSFLSDSNTVTASFTSDDSGAGVGFRALYSSCRPVANETHWNPISLVVVELAERCKREQIICDRRNLGLERQNLALDFKVIAVVNFNSVLAE